MAVKVEFEKADVLFEGTPNEVKFSKGDTASVSESIFADGKKRGIMKLYVEKATVAKKVKEK